MPKERTADETIALARELQQLILRHGGDRVQGAFTIAKELVDAEYGYRVRCFGLQDEHPASPGELK